MKKVRRLLACFLCMVMILSSLPMEAMASETPQSGVELQSLEETADAVELSAPEENYEEVTGDNDSSIEIQSQETQVEDEEDINLDDSDDVIIEDDSDIVIDTTEEIDEEEIVLDDIEEIEETEAEETEESDENILESGGWKYYVNDEGYAVITGYTDLTETSLSVPIKVDEYYVVAIDSKAFVENTSLQKMYVHGNVHSIAEDAFEGLGLTLSGYNGTAILKYAKSYGYDSKVKSDQDYFAFKESVIDFSYTDNGRYSFVDESTIKMSMPEAAELNAGDIFFLPVAYDDLLGVYQIVSIEKYDTYALISVVAADYEDVLNSISVQEELLPDWSQAQWEDGVEIIEEKVSGNASVSGSISLNFKKDLGKQKVKALTPEGSDVAIGDAKGKLFVTGTFSLKGNASVDVDILKAKINDASVTFEPSVTVKGGISFDTNNTSDHKYTKVEMVKPSEYKYKIGSVPLVGAKGVLSVDVAVYVKVSASGEITLTFGGSGELGVKYNSSTKKWDSVNSWKWNTPTIDGSVTIEIGPDFSVELNCAVLGKVVSLEAFAGGVLEATLKGRFGGASSGSTDKDQVATGEAGICVDVGISGKISLTANVDLKLLKDVLKIKGSWEVFSIKKKILTAHWELRSGFVGFVDSCTISSKKKVKFSTFTSESLPDQEILYNAKITEPSLTEIPNNKFLGWYTDQNYTTKWDFDKDTVKNDMVLYAKWEKTTKTVVFVTKDSNVGAADFTEQYIPGAKINEPAMKISKWKLNGWYTDEAFTDKWDFTKDEMPNSDLTLYGSWTYDDTYDPFATSDVKYTISGGKLYYNNHVYEHIADYQLFSAARANAEAKGGYLVTINSQEEMDAVLKYVQDDCAQTTLWLGVNSLTDWKYWLNGEKVTYWNGVDPQTSSSQYNGIFYRSNGTWGTYDNSDTSHYVIEYGDYTVDPGFSAYMNSATSGSVQYSSSTSGDGVSVVGFTSGEEVTISAIHDDDIVKEISARAFQNDTTLKTITIPSTVEKIGDYAFADCESLEEIVIPVSVTQIGTHVFDGCKSLKRVVLPSGIIELPDYTFYGCASLSEVLNMNDLTTIGESAFYGCKKLESFTVPNKLQVIKKNAFYNCTGLKTLTFNSKITTIGNSAFYNCTSLTGKISIPASCTSIGNSAFYGCTSLEHVFLYCKSSAIESSAFGSVDAVFYGTPKDGIDVWCSNNSKTYSNTDQTYKVTFSMPNGNTYQPSLSGTKDGDLLEDVYLKTGSYITEPEVSLDGYILEGWYTDPEFKNPWDFARDTVGYENITLYAHWVEEASAFEYFIEDGKAYLTSYNGDDENVSIPEKLGGYTVYGVCEGAFAGSDKVKQITIPSTVQLIEAESFKGCSNLYNIIFSGGNENYSINSGVLFTADGTELICALEGRTLVSYVVPEGVTKIARGAFVNHTNLKKIEIPDSVVEIEENALPYSTFLTVYGAFDNCAAKTYAKENGLGYNEYEVTFFDGDTELFTAVVESGELLTEFSELDSDYATYGGWYKDAACNEEWDFKTDTMPAGNLNLYLKWNSDFEVDSNSNGLTITGYVGNGGNVKIPESINGTKVTKIAKGAFVNVSGVISLDIPDAIATIENGAIVGGSTLTIIGNDGSTAQKYADSNGIKFEFRTYTISFDVNGGAEILPMSFVPGEKPELPIPVKSNGYFMGWYTSSFYTVKWGQDDVMPAENITLYASWQTINNQISDDYTYVVNEDGTATITEYTGSKIAISIPAEINGYVVSTIGDYAFYENSVIQTVSIPASVTTLGEYAFANSVVMSISGGTGVKTIGDSCFSGAKALRKAFIPAGITSIPDSCFEYCSSITEVDVPDTIESIGAYSFYDCKFLAKVSIPESVTEIGTGAFAGENLLKEVSIPSSLSNVDEGVFGDANIKYYAVSKLNILNIQQKTKNSVHLEWNEVNNADAYKVYRKQGTAGKYSLIKTVTTTSTDNYSLTAGVTYYYKVVAIQNGNTDPATLAESSEYEIKIARLSTPTVSSLVASSESTATMKWSSVTDATGYEVWRSYDLNGEYSLLKSVDGNETENTGLIGGRTYYYKVRAYYLDDGQKEYSSFSDIFKFEMPLLYLNIPEGVSVRQTASGTIYLTWQDVEYADGYRVYRRRGTGDYSLVKTTQENYIYNYNLVLGSTYEYIVEAYGNTDRETVYSNKSQSVSVKIESLATPQIKSVVQSAPNTALVTWTSISAADGYELWRSRTENGKYSLMKSVEGTATSNYNLSVGGTYYYKVRAYKTKDDGEVEYGSYSAAMPITIITVAKTRIKSVEQVAGDSAKVVWAYMSSAKSYEVWRSISDNEHYELLRTTTGTAIQDCNLLDGQTYYYKIRAYDDEGETTVYGDFSDELSICMIGTPVIATLTQNTSNSVFITWDKVKDATGYELYRSTDGTNYTSVKTVSAATTYNYSLTKGTTYYYKLKAYRVVSGTKVYGCYSNAVAVKILGIPEISSLLQNGQDGVKVSWSADSAAEGYELWRRLEDEEKFTKVKNVTGTSTTSFGLYETIASYKMRSYATVNGKKVYGSFGKEMSITILGTPEFKDALQASTSSVSLSWKTVNGATSYKLYRSTSETTGYTLVKSVSDTSTMNYSLTSGTVYYYKLKAVITENGVAHESAYSDPIRVRISDIATPSIKSCVQSDDSVTIDFVKASDVVGTELWRTDKNDDELEYQFVEEGSGDRIVDDTINGGDTYLYKIRMYKLDGDERVYSAFSSPLTLNTLRTPTVRRVAQLDNTSVYVQWNSVENAEYYEVYRTSEKDSPKVTVGTTSENSIMDSISQAGEYYYAVRACLKNGGKISTSAWSAETSVVVEQYTGNNYPETPHNYANNFNKIYTYTQPGAKALELNFSSSTATESGYDFIYVLDGDGACVARLAGSIGNKSIVTKGDTVQLYFTTDGSSTYYGFSFDSINSVSADNAAEPIYSWKISGNTIISDGTSLNMPSRDVFNHLTELVIAEGTTSISGSAFNSMSNITKVTLPSSLTTIGSSAFSGCSGIKEIVLPEGLTTIGSSAFANCTSLSKITMPSTVNSISSSAFNNVPISSAGPKGSKADLEYAWSDAIPAYAFYGMTKLERVTMPSSITSIGKYAFYNCASLKSVDLPNKLTEIGEYAFSDCVGLEKITIPELVTNIGGRAFEDCTKLTDVYVPAGLQHESVTYSYGSQSGTGIFNNCSNLTNVTFGSGTDYIHAGLFAGSGLKSITIPDGVTTIGNYAFSNCAKLTEIVFNSEITTIGDNAFSYCTSLKRVDLPNNITSLGARVFESCTALTNVYIPAKIEYESITYSYGSQSANGIFNNCSNLTTVRFEEGTDYIHGGLFAGSGLRTISIPSTVTGIGAYAFSNCNKLTTVNLNEGLTTIGTNVFSDDSELTEIVIPNGVTVINDYTFYNCTSLEKAVLPERTTSINTNAFRACTSLEEINIPESVTTIGTYAFYDCTSLKEIIIPDGVTTIGNYAFYNCTSLAKLHMPQGTLSTSSNTFTNIAVKSAGPIGSGADFEFSWTDTIPAYAFNNYSSLTDVILPDTIKTIEDYAFQNCTNLKNVTLSKSLESIGNYAFSGCSSIRSLDMPEGMLSIGNYAFQNCTIIKRFSLPTTLTSIGSYAFQYCTDITKISIPSGVSTIGQYTFRGCTSLETVELHEGLTAINSYAFCNDSKLNNVVIPNGVTNIGNYAFQNCTALTDLTVPGSVTSISQNTFSGIGATTAGPIGGDYGYKYGWTETIPSYAFSYMSKLTSATVKNGIKSIGSYAFYGDSAMESVTLGTGLETIGSNAFYNNSKLNNVVIPNGVTTIGNYAFQNCTVLTDLTVPGSVTSISQNTFSGIGATTAGPIGGDYGYKYGWTESIPSYAFSYMSKLTSATVKNGIKSIGNYAFYGDSAMESVTLGTGLETIGSYAFYNNSKLASVVIPSGVTSIGSYAFKNCSVLTDVDIPDSVTTIGSYAFRNASKVVFVCSKNSYAAQYAANNSITCNYKN